MGQSEQNRLIRQLIEEIRIRPFIWDTKHHLHASRQLINESWHEIAGKIQHPGKLFSNARYFQMINSNDNFTPAALVKTKWKGLRDNFRKEVKKCIQQGDSYTPWIHFHACGFLWDVLDTTQLDCAPEKLAELKEKYGNSSNSSRDNYTNYYDTSDTYNQSSNMTYDGSYDDSMDFHDFMFADDTMNDLSQDPNGIYDPDGLEEGEIHPGSQGGENGDHYVEIIESVEEPIEIQDDDYNDSNSTNFGQLPPLQIAEVRSISPPVYYNNFKKFVPKKKIQKVVRDDTDTHFLKSLVPYLKQIDSKRKKTLKQEIKNMLIREVNGITEERTFIKDEESDEPDSILS